MRRVRKVTPRDVNPVERAVEAALARRERAEAQESARARAAGLRAALEADRQSRALPGGGWCQRCGNEYPSRWADAVGVDGLPSPCCQACAEPQAGAQGAGWSRPVLAPGEVAGVLLSRLLGLPVDVPWLADWGRERFGLTFEYAPGPQAPWAHVDVDAWREVGRRAADRHRAFGGPHVPGNLTLTPGAREAFEYATQARQSPMGGSYFETQPVDQDAEEAAVQLRLAVLDAEAAAKVSRLEADARAVERSRARYRLAREFRAAQAERERQFRALLAAG